MLWLIGAIILMAAQTCVLALLARRRPCIEYVLGTVLFAVGTVVLAIAAGITAAIGGG